MVVDLEQEFVEQGHFVVRLRFVLVRSEADPDEFGALSKTVVISAESAS